MNETELTFDTLPEYELGQFVYEEWRQRISLMSSFVYKKSFSLEDLNSYAVLKKRGRHTSKSL